MLSRFARARIVVQSFPHSALTRLNRKWFATSSAAAASDGSTVTSTTAKPPAPKRRRVVIVGSGFSAQRLVHELRSESHKFQPIDLVMISPRNYFLFTPLLPSTSVGTLEFRSIIEPVRGSVGAAVYSNAAPNPKDASAAAAQPTTTAGGEPLKGERDDWTSNHSQTRFRFYQHYVTGVDYHSRTIQTVSYYEDNHLVSASPEIDSSAGEADVTPRAAGWPVPVSARDTQRIGAAALGIDPYTASAARPPQPGDARYPTHQYPERPSLRRSLLFQFDDLVIATGCAANTFGVPGVTEHAFFMRVRVLCAAAAFRNLTRYCL